MSLASLPPNFRYIRQVAHSTFQTVSLGQLIRKSRPDAQGQIESGRWLQQQLPVRHARRIEDFLQLPHVVVSNPHIQRVLNQYLETFEAVTSFPTIENLDQAGKFRDILIKQMTKHGDGTRHIAEGYRQIRKMFPSIRLDDFLHCLFTSRIATRILMENFVIMHAPMENHVGVVRKDMRPQHIVESLSADLLKLTQSVYGCAPELEFRGNLDCTLDYIPRHIAYMLQEVLKNALRATVERHQNLGHGFSNLPAVVVELQKGDVHVIIKISDQGGGMSKKLQREAWQYGWTTVSPEPNDGDPIQPMGNRSDYHMKTELAGFGFGLPLTRLHAQYFGGDVFMQALPGHGIDMYLLLTHLKEGTPGCEQEDLATVLETQVQERGTFPPKSAVVVPELCVPV